MYGYIYVWMDASVEGRILVKVYMDGYVNRRICGEIYVLMDGSVDDKCMWMNGCFD